MPKLVDLAGKKFGRLLVLHRTENRRWGHTSWLCQCECGVEKKVLGELLRDGRAVSCGCYGTEQRKKLWSFRKDKLPEGVAARRLLVYKWMQQARRNGKSWSLIAEDALALSQRPCYYCGIEPLQPYFPKHYSGGCFYNGLDRVDNARGYELDNVVPCCGTCNKAKHTQTQDSFLSWLLRASEYQRDKNRGF
jgi:hypothetical protein